jgi:hypothetical protein
MIHRKSWLLAAFIFALPSASFAQLQIPLSDATRTFPAVGMALLKNNPAGPDDLSLTLRKLEANRTYTVFLAANQIAGALPAQLLGQFTADATGNGTFAVKTEVQNAFAPSNPELTDENGIAPPGSGETSVDAFALPLNWIRIYQASPDAGYDGSVFGTSEFNPGGFQVASSQLSFDRATPLAADAGPDRTVRAPRMLGQIVSIILDGAASRGAISSYSFEVISTPPDSSGNPSGRSSCLISFEEASDFLNAPPLFIVGIPVKTPVLLGSCLTNAVPPAATLPSQAQLVINGSRFENFQVGQVFNDLAGKSIVVRLTVTDLVGNKASDDVTIRLVR